MLTVAPPRMLVPGHKNGKRQKYYTIHTKDTDIFTLTVDPDDLTCVMAFKSKHNAVFVANMIETYYVEEKQWPDVHDPNTLILPKGKLTDLVHSSVKEWTLDSLTHLCRDNVLDFLSISQIMKDGEFKFIMRRVSCLADDAEFYKNRFEQLLPHGKILDDEDKRDGWID